MAFVQIIEYSTSRPDEVRRLGEQWEEAAKGRATARRGVFATDRDHPDRHVEIVFFDSYEEAMQNSELPETQEFASKLRTVMDGEPTFRNLDVIEDRTLG